LIGIHTSAEELVVLGWQTVLGCFWVDPPLLGIAVKLDIGMLKVEEKQCYAMAIRKKLLTPGSFLSANFYVTYALGSWNFVFSCMDASTHVDSNVVRAAKDIAYGTV
jgi:hypothetical protein